MHKALIFLLNFFPTFCRLMVKNHIVITICDCRPTTTQLEGQTLVLFFFSINVCGNSYTTNQEPQNDSPSLQTDFRVMYV